MTNGTGSIEDLIGDKGPGAHTPKKPTSTPSTDSTQQKLKKKMGAIRLEQEEKAVEHAAAVAGIPYVNLKGFPITPEALRLLPEERARELKMMPFLLHGEELRIGAVDAKDQAVIDTAFQIGERHKLHPEIYLISEDGFEKAVEFYKTLPKILEVKKGVEISEEDVARYQAQIHKVQDVQPLIESVSITDLISVIMAAALEIGTSDVHIEAEEKGIELRYRIDGILQNVALIPRDRWDQLINRIKLIAGLKMNLDSVPQDGRFTIFISGEKIDVRTSTLPTAFGESVVMRLLIPSAISLEFEQLGFRPKAFAKLEAEIVKPNGMIITTGPTGSGKTTTLYAILKKLNTEDVKIITLEDPIEYKLEGINQSQIDHSKDYTFSKGLRSILRQDPDIVMVGEIRDKETADTAVQAALTGHLLLSTIHTNDAAGAVPRFLGMGVQSALLAPALRIVMGQRLLRRLCEKCKRPVELAPDVAERVKKIIGEIPVASGETPDYGSATFMEAVGCDACTSGYKGRVGIYEILVVNGEVEELIRGGSVTDLDMKRVAEEQGMVNMEQDGILKAMEGLTSVE